MSVLAVPLAVPLTVPLTVQLAAGPSLDELTVGQALLILGGALALVEAIRRAWPFARDFVLFVVELVGAPERNGRPARPGLLAEVRAMATRLEDVESAVTRVEETAAAAASSAAAANDKVEHVSEQVDEVRGLAEDVRDQQHALAAEQTQIRQRLEQFGPADPSAAQQSSQPGQSGTQPPAEP